jgi:hypothetical protein
MPTGYPIATTARGAEEADGLATDVEDTADIADNDIRGCGR